MSFLAKKSPQSSQDCGPAFFALWAAGTGSPAGSPYHVGVREPTENQRNGIVEIFVFKTAGSNIRLQRCRGVPQARPSLASRRVLFGKIPWIFVLLFSWRCSKRMPNAHPFAFEHENRRPGRASLRAAPTTLESGDLLQSDWT